MDFSKILEQMVVDGSPRGLAQAELSLLTEAYLDRMLKLTTIAANMSQIDPVAGKEWLDSMAIQIDQLSTELVEAKAKFEKEHGEV